MRRFIRRLAIPVAAVTAAAGLLVLGTPATADEAPPTTFTGTTDNLIFTKSVIGNAAVHPGDTVTYKTEIKHNESGIERSIAKIRDIPPAGFVLVPGSAKATYLGVTNRATISNESDGGVSAKCSSGCTFLVGGFVVKKNQPVTLEATYTVPVGTAFGTYDSGMLFDVNAFSTQQGLNPINVNVQVVDPSVATGTTLVAPATAKVGTPVDLTATVAPSDASGTVQFKDGGNDIGSPVPVSGGSATLSHTFDSVGAHDITAAYNAGAGFHSSTSGVQTVDVSADTTTTISAPNAALVGDSITVSAVVTPANAVGTVQFKDGDTNLGAPVAVVDGTASLTRSYDASGTHSFTAVFTGEAGYGDSVSTATQLDVSDPDWGTTTTVVEPLTAVVGEPTNLSATVSPIPSSGTVTFKVDGAEVGTAPVGTGDGVAILPHTFASAGAAAVVAEFSGGTGFIGSTSTSFTVNVTDPEPARADTTTVLTVSGSAQVGKALQLKATVAPGTANGMIQFKSGTTPIGAPVAVVNGVATLTHTFDDEGTFGLTANFVGDAGWKNSVSGPTVVQVGTAPTDGGGTGSVDTGSLSGLIPLFGS
ncbi:Ig-like domain (group 3) [Rhodococcus erythropolis]|uniref:Ig-like domain-containing protein n=1 Tax=Rhodococcus erythropolis TaxID=1833 RepID=UPI000876D35D|nr:Ig-like domain-containing protein [Rhodococcus erythropolis]SCY40653.1 Ig-like domain (group 3) [Rhodococcus erythropolis]